MDIIPLEEVEAIRARRREALALAAQRFQEHFAASTDLPPNERWRGHLQIQAAALLEKASGVHLAAGYSIAYAVEEGAGRIVQPYAVAKGAASQPPPERLDPGAALYRYFTLEPTREALLEYWFVVSEIVSSPSWAVTRLIVEGTEYDEALRQMKQPQMVRPFAAAFLPAGEWRADGTALLEVTVYTRARKERIERRVLLLDRHREYQFHNRELIAEGSGGVAV
jgi:hypothetical protein